MPVAPLSGRVLMVLLTALVMLFVNVWTLGEWDVTGVKITAAYTHHAHGMKHTRTFASGCRQSAQVAGRSTRHSVARITRRLAGGVTGQGASAISRVSVDRRRAGVA